MFHRRDFMDFSSSLGSLCFADNVILALARMLKAGKLREEDVPLLKMADDFFSDVISGYSWTDNPSVSERSLQSATAFTDAANAIAVSVVIPTPAAFLKHVERLKAVAEVLHTNRHADDPEVRELQEFFTAFGYSQLHKADDIANRKEKHESWP